MFKNLGPGAIGIRGLALPEAIKLAKETGFAGLDFNIREAAALANERGLDYVRGLFAQAGVRPGSWGLPVAWNKEDLWQKDLAELPRLAALGRDLGCTRTATWCPSWSDERDYAENWAWHVARFRPIAAALKEQGCRLGIEFLGPKTLRAPHKYSFICTMDEMLKLAADLGAGNVGLLLDAYHLYTSGGNAEDLARLAAHDVVTVHVNDAPAGIAREEQADTVRCLPMETGVIDLAGFMRRLAAIGYDGPVMAEPFSQRINSLAATDPMGAARTVSDAMDAMWKAAGLRT